jgi:hypothetical protein
VSGILWSSNYGHRSQDVTTRQPISRASISLQCLLVHDFALLTPTKFCKRPGSGVLVGGGESMPLTSYLCFGVLRPHDWPRDVRQRFA